MDAEARIETGVGSAPSGVAGTVWVEGEAAPELELVKPLLAGATGVALWVEVADGAWRVFSNDCTLFGPPKAGAMDAGSTLPRLGWDEKASSWVTVSAVDGFGLGEAGRTSWLAA